MSCGNTSRSRACRGQRNSGRSAGQLRPRVANIDAQKVRARVEERAAQLQLRGARRWVLTAVLELLCDWSRITDDRVRLSQLVALIAACGGRRYDLKTIGRALSSLAEDRLLVYRAAQGRGAQAFIAIHDQFVSDVAVLDRDESGRVIVAARPPSEADSVTFSGPGPYIDQSTYPPTPRTETLSETSRPSGVQVSTAELRHVLASLPAPLAQLPKHLRWMLGAQIRRRLHAGWRPDQILDVLAAPMPEGVRRPWRLALWRLRHNIVGSGPRLKPVQQAWDAQAAAVARDAAAAAVARWYDQVTAVTSRQQRADLLRADELKFGRRSPDPTAALAAAGSRVARLYPDLPLAAALLRWSEEIFAQHPQSESVTAQPEPESATVVDDLLMNLGIGGSDCVVCAARPGTMRPELPLAAASTVCDHCWPHIATELAAGDAAEYTDKSVEAIPA